MASPASEPRLDEFAAGASRHEPAHAADPGSGRLPLSEWNRRIEVLERAPVFFTLPAATLRATARRLRRVEVTAGAVILRQGEVGDSLLLIESGRAALRVESEGAPATTVATLGSGDLFGEAGCLDGEPSPASLVALADTRLLALDRQSLEPLLAREPDALAGLHRLAEQRRRTFPALAHRDEPAGLAQVIAVYSAKGGAGKTTVALNLAGALAERHPGSVLLVDLALPFNHAALLANLMPSGSLARVAAGDPARLDEALLGAVVYHGGGMLLLPGTLRAEESDALRPGHVQDALATLRPAFRYIVLDLSTDLDDVALAALEAAQRVVLVTTPELTTLYGAAELSEILTIGLGLPPESVTVVLNQRAPKSGVSKDAVAHALGREVDVEIRYDGAKPDEAALRGALNLEDPKSEVAIAARALAKLLDGRAAVGAAG
jgi:MinD-like ATPase involved in chromosome partitioning or flagellar assembly